MSGPGTLEFQRVWDLRRNADFTQEPPVIVSDNAPDDHEYYLGRIQNGQVAYYRIQPPPYIPGQAAVEHEMGHDIQFAISERTGHVTDWIAELFQVRGAPLPTAPDSRTRDAASLAVEQACSMIPEAFIGEWGGYKHPLYDNIYDPAGAAQKVQAYYVSPLADRVRWFFRNYMNWQPKPVVQPVLSSPALPIIWTPSPNFTGGRSMPITNVVVHWTVATAEQTIAHFKDPTAKVSAHYLVARNGQLYQFVYEDDMAWHDAQPGWNEKSIGIEHEHLIGQDWPQIQLVASANLVRDITDRHALALDRTVVLGHRETGYPTQCPGDLPIDELVGGTVLTPAEVKAIAVQAIAEAGLDPKTIELIKAKLDTHVHVVGTTGKPQL